MLWGEAEAGEWLRHDEASEGAGDGARIEAGEVLRVDVLDAWRLCIGTYLDEEVEEAAGECECMTSVDSITLTRGMAIGLDIAEEMRVAREHRMLWGCRSGRGLDDTTNSTWGVHADLPGSTYTSLLSWVNSGRR